MKIRYLSFVLFFFLALSTGYTQGVKGNYLEIEKATKPGEKREVLAAVDMYDKDCIHIVDGIISDYKDIVPQYRLAHFISAASQDKLEKLGFSDDQCVMIKSTRDLEVENFIYRQVDKEVRRVGIQYKMPIVVNGTLQPSHQERHSQLSELKTDQIKKIHFLDKAAAQAKYGDKVVFGLIEIEV